MKKDLDKYGYTPHCRRCECIQAKKDCTDPHNDVCRLRICRELEKTPEGVARLAKVAERWGLSEGQNTHNQAEGGSRGVLPRSAPPQPAAADSRESTQGGHLPDDELPRGSRVGEEERDAPDDAMRDEDVIITSPSESEMGDGDTTPRL